MLIYLRNFYPGCLSEALLPSGDVLQVKHLKWVIVRNTCGQEHMSIF